MDEIVKVFIQLKRFADLQIVRLMNLNKDNFIYGNR